MLTGFGDRYNDEVSYRNCRRKNQQNIDQQQNDGNTNNKENIRERNMKARCTFFWLLVSMYRRVHAFPRI